MFYYLVAYDLRMPGKDYTGLYAAIKQITKEWQHPMESTWLLRTDLSAKEIYDRLKTEIDRNDRIFVIRVNENDKQGWLPKSFWEWINQEVV